MTPQRLKYYQDKFKQAEENKSLLFKETFHDCLSLRQHNIIEQFVKERMQSS